MPQMPDLEFVEGETYAFTWTLNRDDAVLDITGDTITIFARDNLATVGTNRINGSACTIVGAGTNGQARYVFTTGNTTITESTERATDIEGTYALKIVDGTETFWSPQGKFKVLRNPFIVTT